MSSLPAESPNLPRPKRKRRWMVATLVLVAAAVVCGFWMWDGGQVTVPPPPGVEGPFVDLSRTELLELLRRSHAAAAKLKDYSAVLVKQERVQGKLLEEQQIALKVRHDPFSAYLRFLAPESKEGTEALYVEGKNEGKMWARGVGLQGLLGTLSLDPEGMLAMQGQKYPITNIGMKHLAARLISGVEKAGRSRHPARSQIRLYEDQSNDGRACRCITIFRPPADEETLGRLLYVFIDRNSGLLARYEGHDWSGNESDPPVLDERYEYHDVRPDQELEDEDFDASNPEYDFE